VVKQDIFQYVQLQYLTFVNKVIIMQFKFSQNSVATVCRWSGQMDNCCVATYLSILCAKLYENRSMFVKNTAKWKRLAFFGTWFTTITVIDCLTSDTQHGDHDATGSSIDVYLPLYVSTIIKLRERWNYFAIDVVKTVELRLKCNVAKTELKKYLRENVKLWLKCTHVLVKVKVTVPMCSCVGVCVWRLRHLSAV